MTPIETYGLGTCAAVCAAACFSGCSGCFWDGPVFIADALTGLPGLASGGAAGLKI